jgi:hypothetical protein
MRTKTFFLLTLMMVPIVAACGSSQPAAMSEPSRNNATPTRQPADATPLPVSMVNYELVGSSCNEKECLFKSGNDIEIISLGVVTITGYYQQIEEEFENQQKVTCDYFVVVAGSQKFQRELFALIDYGNTVNRRNESGQLVVGISLRALNPTERDKVLGSTSEHPVSLVVLSPTPPASMGDYCLTFVNILKVKQP